MMRFWFSLLFLVLLSPGGQALPVLDLASPHMAIGEAVSVLRDDEGQLSLHQVMALPSDRFAPLGQPVASHTFTRAAYWYRFNVENHSLQPLTRILWLSQAWLDRADFAVVSPQQQITLLPGGNGLPFAQRAIALPLPNVRHNFEPGRSTVYLRVQTPDPFIVSINLMAEGEFLYAQMIDGILGGLIYGAIFAMLLYNLLLYMGTRETYQLAYVGYLATFLLMNAAYNNYTFPLWFADWPAGQDWMQSGAIFLFLCAGLAFTRSFLDLQHSHRRLYRVTTVALYLLVGLGLIGPLIGYPLHVELSIILSSLVSSYSFVMGLYSWLQGNRSARFFLLGTMSGLVGTMVTACTVMAFIPFHYMTYKALDFGLVVDGILMSLALTDRIKLVREQRLRAELDSRTDSLTGFYNRRGYQEISQLGWSRLTQRQLPLSAMLIDINYFKQVNDEYGHAAGDALLQHVALLLRHQLRKLDYAFRMGGDEFLLLLPGIDCGQASHLAERLRKAMECTPLRWEGNELPISVSIGLSEWQPGEENLEALLRRADSAMYQQKTARLG